MLTWKGRLDPVYRRQSAQHLLIQSTVCMLSRAWLGSRCQRDCMVPPFTHGLTHIVLWQLRILGSTRTPFGVRGGGHAFNPGFSSTSGVQIAMTRFKIINLDTTTKTVDVGSGVIWDQVYATLDSSGFNLVGGRIPSVGISGLTLGGGG